MLRVQLLLALCGTLAVAACGVKGPLEPPPGAHATPQPQAAAPGAPAPGTPAYATARYNDQTVPHADWEKQQKKQSTGGGASSSLLQGVERPQQPFILDGLL